MFENFDSELNQFATNKGIRLLTAYKDGPARGFDLLNVGKLGYDWSIGLHHPVAPDKAILGLSRLVSPKDKLIVYIQEWVSPATIRSVLEKYYTTLQEISDKGLTHPIDKRII
jgi:hypothetical protein